jgi:hypothetical protein
MLTSNITQHCFRTIEKRHIKNVCGRDYGETGSEDEITNVGTKYLKINSQIKAIAATHPFSKEL